VLPGRGAVVTESRDGVVFLVPVAYGELIDKITILEIKTQRMTDAIQLANVRRELRLVCAIREQRGHEHAALAELTSELRHLNESLWDIEDGVRDCERRGEFGLEFIGLARSVYKTNDRRSAVKRELDRIGGSAIGLEKLYSRY
jgi:hypothetical protein